MMAPGEFSLNRKPFPNCDFLNLDFLLALRNSLVRFQAPSTAFESLYKLCLKLKKKNQVYLAEKFGYAFFFFF